MCRLPQCSIGKLPYKIPFVLLFLAIGNVLVMGKAEALPGQPARITDNQQVLTDLKAGGITPRVKHLRKLIEADPGNLAALKELVTVYLAAASTTGDDRYLGYAQQLFAPWENLQPPVPVALLQARLLQRQHKFTEAVQILEDAVLATDPRNGEAHLQLAYMKMAQGQAAQANQHCASASVWLSAEAGLSCLARAQALQGRYEDVWQELKRRLNDQGVSRAEREDALLTLSEIAIWQGDSAAAEHYLEGLLGLSPDNILGLKLYTDLLIAHERYGEAQQLLNGREHPALILRYAVCSKARGGDAVQSITDTLARGYHTRLARGDYEADRDDVMLLLALLNQPQQALAAARDYWQKQREPEDALWYLKAAQAVDSAADIQKIRTWVEQTGLQHYDIEQLLTTGGTHVYL